MKKFAKSLLCLIMALMLVFACAACEDNDGGKDDDDEEETTKTVEKDDDLPSLKDAKKAVKDYVSDEETLLEITGMSEMVDSMIGEDLTDEQAEMVEDFIADVLDFIEFDVVDASTESSTNSPAYVTVEITYPDFENLDTTAYTDDTDYMFSKLDELGYTIDDISNITDENELADIMFEFLISVMEDMAGDADMISETFEVEVVYEDGEWVIVE